MIFVRLLRFVLRRIPINEPTDTYTYSSNSEHLKAHSFVHWAVWLGTVAACVTISFILAEAIPFFGALTSRHTSLSIMARV